MRFMLKAFCLVSLLMPVASLAQTIEPGQIRPSQTTGQVLTTVTSGHPPQWQNPSLGNNPPFTGLLSGPKISLAGDGVVPTGVFTNNVTSFPSFYFAPQSLRLFSNFLTAGQDNYSIETTETNHQDQTDAWTPGTAFNNLAAMHMVTTGDTIWSLVEVLSKGNSSVQNEGIKLIHGVTAEFPSIFQGTMNSATCGVTCTFSLTQTQGYQQVGVNNVPTGNGGIGAKLHLIDVPNAITTGYITGYSGVNYATFTGSGTAFSTPNGTSAITTTTTSIGSTASATVNGTVTLSNPSGFAASGTNLICFFSPSNGDSVWTCAYITNLTGSVATIDYIPQGFLFPAGGTVSQGGLAGWGFSLDWDSHCASVQTGCPGGLNGYSIPPDNAYAGIVRQVYPVVGNTSATSLQVYGFSRSQTPASGGTSTTGPYHLFPQVLVYDAYNHTTGKLDASAVQTSPINQGMTFSTSDVLEQPNYFSVRTNAITVSSWRVNASPLSLAAGYNFTYGGNWRDGDELAPFIGTNNPCLYMGFPSGVQPLLPWQGSTGCSGAGGVYGTGQGQYGGPYGMYFYGSPVANGLVLGWPTAPPGYNGLCGAAVFVGCQMTTAMALQWNQASHVLGHTNALGGQSFVDYYPNWTGGNDAWDINVGSTTPYETGAIHYTFATYGATLPGTTAMVNATCSGTCTGFSGGSSNYAVNQSSTVQPIQINTVVSGSNYLWVQGFGGHPGWAFQTNTAASTWTTSLFNMDASYDALFSGCAPGDTTPGPNGSPCHELFGILGNSTNYTNNLAYFISVPNVTTNYVRTLPACTGNCYLFALPTGASANAIPTVGTGGQGGVSSCSDNGTIVACSEPVQAPSFSATGATQHTVACSTSGNAYFIEPSQGTYNKLVQITLAACVGTASWTYDLAFTQTPSVQPTNDLAATIVTSRSASAVTVTGSTSTGTLTLVGY